MEIARERKLTDFKSVERENDVFMTKSGRASYI